MRAAPIRGLVAAMLTATPCAAQVQQGSWTSDGYGLLLEVARDTLRAYEVTSVSCIPSFTATAVSAPAGALGAYRFTGAPVTVLLLPDQGPDRARYHFNGAASDVIIHRAAQKPAVCDRATANTPTSNFDVFARTWSEQYGFFDLKKTNWAAVVAANRPKVTDSTSAAELFAIMRGMIEPLQDAHTYLAGPDASLRFSGSRSGEHKLQREQFPRAYDLVTRYLTGGLRKFCEGQLEFGMLAGDIGYLRIRGFSRYHADGSFDSGLQALEAALDTIFAGASTWKGLVTDVRINGGGADPLGLTIAGRLTDKDYVAYVKEARLDPNDPARWTPGQTSWVRATNRPSFRGPVVHLTGIHSVSAAETFTQALINRKPAVTRVGENTQGVFSDVLGRRLPNGWRFGLPNERFVTNGKSYDGPGIPPDVRVAVFPASDLESGKDGALERAIEILSAKPR
jgi:peptidase S41-like protein